MTTDFNYNNKTINSGGPIKPSGKDQPGDPRTRVESYSDIESIPNPYVGMIITVKMDETNQNKMTDYKVLSLKANTLGVANSVIDRVQKYSDYLGISNGSSGTGGTGLTSEQEEQLNKIPEMEASINNINESLNTKANTSDIPTNTSELYNDSGFLTSIPSEYVTETEMNEAIANVSSGGSVDLSGYATKDELNTKANISDIPTNTSELYNDSNFVTKSYVDSITVIPEGSLTMIDIIDGEVFSVLDGSSSEVYGSIVLSTSSLSFNENDSSSFTVKLSQAPTNNQTVNIKVNNGYCTIDKSSLTFTSSNYSIAQTVTVTGVADSSSYSNKSSVITLSSAGVSSKTITVTLVNTDVEPVISSISAVYTQGDTIVYPTTSLDSLKSNLVVTANYTNSTSTTVTGYALSGTLTEGTSTITVTYSGKTTTFNVNVSPEQSSVAVTGITINETASIEVGKSISLIASISPSEATDKTVTWNVDNANCTITPNGLSCTIKGVTEGSSIVTVTTTDGNYTDSCTVTITAKQSTSIPTENLIRNYDFTAYSNGTVEDQVGGLNINPTGTVVNNGLLLSSNLNVKEAWDRTKSSTLIVTSSATKPSKNIYLGDNTIYLGEGTITISHGNGAGNTVGTVTDKCNILNCYNVYALTIDVSNKHQQLYFNGELILEGNYVSDWSENAMLLYSENIFNRVLIYDTILDSDTISSISSSISIEHEDVPNITINNIVRYFDFTTSNSDGVSDIIEPYGIGRLSLSPGSYDKTDKGITLTSGSALTEKGYLGLETVESEFTIGIRIEINLNANRNIIELFQYIILVQNELNIYLKNNNEISNKYLATTGVPFNIFITNNSSNILSLYVNGNLIGTITKTKTNNIKPYLLNENIVYNKIICINSCLSEDEIKTLNNEVI